MELYLGSILISISAEENYKHKMLIWLEPYNRYDHKDG